MQSARKEKKSPPQKSGRSVPNEVYDVKCVSSRRKEWNLSINTRLISMERKKRPLQTQIRIGRRISVISRGSIGWKGLAIQTVCVVRSLPPPPINARNRVRGKSLQVARTTFIVLDEEEATCASHGKWYLFRLFFFVRGASAGTGNVRRCWAATKTTGRNTFLDEKKNLRSFGKLDNRVACFFE